MKALQAWEDEGDPAAAANLIKGSAEGTFRSKSRFEQLAELAVHAQQRVHIHACIVVFLVGC